MYNMIITLGWIIHLMIKEYVLWYIYIHISFCFGGSQVLQMLRRFINVILSNFMCAIYMQREISCCHRTSYIELLLTNSGLLKQVSLLSLAQSVLFVCLKRVSQSQDTIPFLESIAKILLWHKCVHLI